MDDQPNIPKSYILQKLYKKISRIKTTMFTNVYHRTENTFLTPSEKVYPQEAQISCPLVSSRRGKRRDMSYTFIVIT